MELNDEGLLIGAAVTIAELEDRLKTIIPTLPGICVRFNQYMSILYLQGQKVETSLPFWKY